MSFTDGSQFEMEAEANARYAEREKQARRASGQDLVDCLDLVLDFYSLPTVDFVTKHGPGITTKQMCDKIKATLKERGIRR